MTTVTKDPPASSPIDFSREQLTLAVLEILNDSMMLSDAISRILHVIKDAGGYDAVGIRLASGNDFPYAVQSGFPADFLLTENSIVERNAQGGLCHDATGAVNLECTCGIVISGKTDPKNPLFTKGGSAWTNNSLPILDFPPDLDPRLHPRNNCIHKGYRSIALVPIRHNNNIIGLLQINDHREDCFTLDIIEFFEGLSASIGIALTGKMALDALQRKSLELEESNKNLQHALDNIKTLQGLLPICAYCKKIRDDKGYWNQIEVYIKERSDADFSHGICPTCMEKHLRNFSI